MRWTQSSNFGATTIFVTTSIDELGVRAYQYGKIEILATGTRQQTPLGNADSGQIIGNKIIVRLSVDKLSAANALGYDPVGATSTATEVIAQILIGVDAAGGSLFPSDIANGSDFKVE